MQSLDDMMQKLSRTGARLDNLERAVTAAKDRLRFWQVTALTAGGVAVVLFLVWRRARENLENCEQQKRL